MLKLEKEVWRLSSGLSSLKNDRKLYTMEYWKDLRINQATLEKRWTEIKGSYFWTERSIIISYSKKKNLALFPHLVDRLSRNRVTQDLGRR